MGKSVFVCSNILFIFVRLICGRDMVRDNEIFFKIPVLKNQRVRELFTRGRKFRYLFYQNLVRIKKSPAEIINKASIYTPVPL
jgi:hypothetical protein